MELTGHPQSPVKPLITDGNVTGIPIAAQKDGMALTPGLYADSINTIECIDSQSIKAQPSTNKAHMKEKQNVLA